jgi:hypothetical protein
MRRGHRLAQGGHAQGDCTHGQLVADPEGLLAEDPLAVDERAVGTAQVPDGESAVDIEELTMPPAHLRGFDPDDAIIVTADAGHAIGQPEGRRGAPASDDLKYIIHRGYIPIECAQLLGIPAEMG